MHIKGIDNLDECSRGQLVSELARHEESVRSLPAGDGLAAAAELNGHLGRIDRILADHESRRLGRTIGPLN